MDNVPYMYEGPRRREGERDYKGGNGIHLHGPRWLGGISITGQHVIALSALLILAAGGGVGGYFIYQANLKQAEALSLQANTMASMQIAVKHDHENIYRVLELQRQIADETLCQLTLLDEQSRRAAIRSGSICGYIGVKPHILEIEKFTLDR